MYLLSRVRMQSPLAKLNAKSTNGVVASKKTIEAIEESSALQTNHDVTSPELQNKKHPASDTLTEMPTDLEATAEATMDLSAFNTKNEYQIGEGYTNPTHTGADLIAADGSSTQVSEPNTDFSWAHGFGIGLLAISGIAVSAGGNSGGSGQGNSATSTAKLSQEVATEAETQTQTTGTESATSASTASESTASESTASESTESISTDGSTWSTNDVISEPTAENAIQQALTDLNNSQTPSAIGDNQLASTGAVPTGEITPTNVTGAPDCMTGVLPLYGITDTNVSGVPDCLNGIIL